MAAPVTQDQSKEPGLRLIRTLHARSVLILGSAGTLGPGLFNSGLLTHNSALSSAALASTDASYDLALCLDAPELPPEESGKICSLLARQAASVLFSTKAGTSGVTWLRAFAALGLGADLSFDARSVAPGAVLLRPGTTDVASLVAELLSLRARLPDPGAPPAADGPLRSRQDELERAVKQLHAFVSTAKEREELFQEKTELRIAQLHARTSQTSHLVQAMANSRIWRTLVTSGGILLNIQKFHTRLLSRPAGPRHDAGSDPVLRVHCDEPNGETLDRMLHTGVSGALRVRGWAVATSGIERVELRLENGPLVEARTGLYRPDLVRSFPEASNAARGGFQGHVDTLTLTNGRHVLTVRAISKRGSVAEAAVSLLIDHANGYADDYHRWIEEFEKRDPEHIALKLSSFAFTPRISVIVPVYRTSPAILEKTIGSVLRQSYTGWELCIADDCSGSPEMDSILKRYAALDERIKITRLPQNGGISKASNAALKMATGEFIALLDHDDELAQDALFHMVDALNRQPEADVLYSDEDHIDEAGLRSDPFFKPDWSPDLALGENYVCHLMLLRTALCRQLGGFRSETDLSQDHDILLRASLKARHIVHVPKILYHWRTNIYASTRASDIQRNRSLETSRRAVENYLKLLGSEAAVEPGEAPGRWRIRYPVPAGQSVRILIPSGGKVDILKSCLNSIAGQTDYPDYQIVVIDNSRGGAVEEFVRKWSDSGRTALYVDQRNQRFNFSRINNFAARGVKDPLLLFLNDDVSIINRGWMTALVEQASRPEVGAVGAKLLYPDGTIQHAGVVMGLLGICGHAFKGAFAEDRHYFDFPDVVRNVSAVTGACLMVQTKRFWEVGGFEEEGLPIAYQDIDLCLKLREKGYRVLYTPHAQLYHHEASSKRPDEMDPHPAETQIFKTRWKHAIEYDPFYNPNLTFDAEDYSYRKRMK